jgi:hypothetical protein
MAAPVTDAMRASWQDLDADVVFVNGFIPVAYGVAA